MTPASSPTKPRSRLMRASVRWLFVLLISALLHMIAIGWLKGKLHFPAAQPTENTAVITAVLETPPAQPVIKTAIKPKPRIRKSPERPAPPQITPTLLPAPAAIESSATTNQPDDFENIDSAALAEPVVAEISDVEDEAHSLRYHIDLPLSVDLKYDVQKIPKEGAPMYGSGTISWHTAGNAYRVSGEFGVLFITALRFESSGTIDDTGIAPELYREKRFRKAETNTHFHRERSTISFSSSTASYPRTGGEQDRASIIWQLAGLGRGDSEKFVAGSSIALFVAGTRHAETWQILIVGQEDVDIDGTSTRTWHVARAPRSGSYEQQLDIWLAPEQNWYPVRLRYTEHNGDQLDMTLTDLNVSTVP